MTRNTLLLTACVASFVVVVVGTAGWHIWQDSRCPGPTAVPDAASPTAAPAEELLEALEERLHEEYGDPPSVQSPQLLERQIAAMTEAGFKAEAALGLPPLALLDTPTQLDDQPLLLGGGHLLTSATSLVDDRLVRGVSVIDTATGQVRWSVEQEGYTYGPVPAGEQLALLVLTDSQRVAVATVDVRSGEGLACVVLGDTQSIYASSPIVTAAPTADGALALMHYQRDEASG